MNGVRREGENRLGAHRPEKEGERLTLIEVQPPGERWNPAVPNHHTPSFQRADYHIRDDDTRTVAVCYAILYLSLPDARFRRSDDCLSVVMRQSGPVQGPQGPRQYLPLAPRVGFRFA